MEWIKIVLVLSLAGATTETTEEPFCLSRFDFEYKMLNKIVEFEQKMREYERIIADQKKMLDSFSMDGRGAVYVRWGKSSCPEDTTQIYNGYIGGKHHQHKGSGSDPLCLPSDPSWLNYTDGQNGSPAYIYGTELALDDDKDRLMFENAANSQDMPCAVCKTLKSTVVMIPARNSCYRGWKLEYRGYLVTENYNHPGSGVHVCLDSRPDFLPNGEKRLNTHIFYKVEAMCEPLPCPPYVAGRELACVVCSD